jgi:tetratricopeptide (TPR) repeat protein
MRTAQIAAIGLCGLSFAPAMCAEGPSQREEPEFRQGRQLERGGKLADALAVYQRALQSQPNSLEANTAAGRVLDLLGRGAEARKYFEKAIDSADMPEHMRRGRFLTKGEFRSGSHYLQGYAAFHGGDHTAWRIS